MRISTHLDVPIQVGDAPPKMFQLHVDESAFAPLILGSNFIRSLRAVCDFREEVFSFSPCHDVHISVPIQTMCQDITESMSPIGVTVNPDKIIAVTHFPTPTDVTLI